MLDSLRTRSTDLWAEKQPQPPMLMSCDLVILARIRSNG
jgi:hypothetical protein